MANIGNEGGESTEMSLVDRIARFKEQDYVRQAMLALPEWVTPNGVTLFRGALMLPCLLLVLYGAYWWALGFFLFSMALDFVDGALALARGMLSETGAFLDPLMDKVSVCLLLLALAGRVPMGWLQLIGVAGIGTWLTYARVKKLIENDLGADGQADIKARPVGKVKLITEVIALSMMLTGLALNASALVWVGSFLMMGALMLGILSLRSHLFPEENKSE